jgi:hypothetical protein
LFLSAEKIMVTFDIRRLINDLGGPAGVAAKLGIARTTPYRWLRSGHLSSRVIARLKEIAPNLSIDSYFTETTPNDASACGSA